MQVNGQRYPFRDGLTLRALLHELAIDDKRVAVMHGDDIYRPGELRDAPVAERDVIEIVTMMAGG
jgi:thiamine biosynthesis protein ThiS